MVATVITVTKVIVVKMVFMVTMDIMVRIIMVIMDVMVVMVIRIDGTTRTHATGGTEKSKKTDRTDRHLNLTFQVTCLGQLLQFLRCLRPHTNTCLSTKSGVCSLQYRLQRQDERGCFPFVWWMYLHVKLSN